MPDICHFLIARGADVTASCQNIKNYSVCPWFTPLYTALWSPAAPYEIIEILLSTPKSIAQPRNPKLVRSDAYSSDRSMSDAKWNKSVLQRLLEVHPAAIELFLDHFAVEINRINGERIYRFTEVCRSIKLGAIVFIGSLYLLTTGL